MEKNLKGIIESVTGFILHPIVFFMHKLHPRPNVIYSVPLDFFFLHANNVFSYYFIAALAMLLSMNQMTRAGEVL